MTGLLHKRHLARHEIDSLEVFARLLKSGVSLSDYVVHALDLTGFYDWNGVDLDGTIFLGCTFESLAQRRDAEDHGAYIFPRLEGLPFDLFRTSLYSVDELMDGYAEGGYVGTRDFQIFEYFDRLRRLECGVPVRHTLAQRIHDHSIDDALLDVIEGKKNKGIVGIMGGHSCARTDPYYRAVAQLTWLLTRCGFFIASGGGPGIMEAANLGAWFANWKDIAVLDEAIAMMATAPTFDGGQQEGTKAYLGAIGSFMTCARAVVERFSGESVDERLATRFGQECASPGESLAIPTWFYGHEPSNVFSTYIAKYFANSIREDGLLAISLGGVVYAPGSAGTLQEIFMDLAQNHYATFEYCSPMVFLGCDEFSHVFDLVVDFVKSRGKENVYGDLIATFDDPAKVVEFIQTHPPRLKKRSVPLYELLKRTIVED